MLQCVSYCDLLTRRTCVFNTVYMLLMLGVLPLKVMLQWHFPDSSFHLPEYQLYLVPLVSVTKITGITSG